jgi:hypothetical protein
MEFKKKSSHGIFLSKIRPKKIFPSRDLEKINVEKISPPVIRNSRNSQLKKAHSYLTVSPFCILFLDFIYFSSYFLSIYCYIFYLLLFSNYLQLFSNYLLLYFLFTAIFCFLLSIATF